MAELAYDRGSLLSPWLIFKMARINKEGYLERKRVGNRGKSKSKIWDKKKWRDWWLVKSNNTGSRGVINLTTIMLPKEYIGKKIKIKFEIIKRKLKEE